MKALQVEGDRLTLREVDKPEAQEEVLVRVILSGICNTDLEIARGYAGFRGTIGHEFVGVVEDSPQGALIGHRVVGEINAGCGECNLCVSGDSRHCPTRTVLGIVGRDGAHAEFLRLPLRNLLTVPANIPDEHAVFTEPLAAACGILERTTIDRNTRVGVIGDGKLGLLCAQVIALTGAPVLMAGKYREKLRILERRGIATCRVDKALANKREFDVVIEASGSAAGFELALDLLKPRGRLVLKSTFHGKTEIDSARLVVDEVTVIGSRCGRFEPALDLLTKNAIDVDSLISEEYSLGEGILAMARAAEKGVLKVLLRP